MESTYMLHAYSARPVFHRYGEMRDRSDWSACGKLLYASGAFQPHAISLPRHHAEKFGRACRSCFRDA